ncbi:PepSY-associated TM helix domain-containing protein, partial [Acinetobacter baumannii]
LLGERGRVLVGLSGLFLLASAITGLVLWWPRSRAGLRQALRIKPGARGLRLHFDLHRSAGFYASLLLAMLGLTGAAMTFPGEARSVLNAS